MKTITLPSRRMMRVSSALLAALLTGCVTPSSWRDEVRGSMDRTLDEARASQPAVPADIGRAMLPPIEITVPEGKVLPLEPRFDLAVNNAPARQVFMGLVEGTPYSMVVHPDVQGTISLALKDVTVPEAMEAIRQVYGYEYRREGQRFYVLGRGLQTRLFNVNYLNLVRKGKSDTRVSGGGIGQRTTGGSGTTIVSQDQTGFSRIQLETLSQADFWNELKHTLAAMIGCESKSEAAAAGQVTAAPRFECKGGRQVVVNAESGVVVVRALPEELRLVEEYIGATHTAVNRQVVLEAKILEVELNDRFQTGINWANLISDNVTIGQIGSANLLTGTGTIGSSDIAGNTGNLNPGASFSGIVGTTASAFGGVFTIAAKTGDFAAFVELLKGQGEVQVLSSPRVSTVNNQKAVIKIGGDEFFVTNVSSTASTTTTGGTVITPTVELASFFSGIVLDVTPQIDEHNNIILHIHPSVSAVTQKNKSFTALGQSFNLPLALSTVQESDNVVRARSGQIIVIGGLMKEGSTDEQAGIPILADIPILGNLFKHKRVTRIKKELVILLKPTVIAHDQDWGEAVGESHERIKRIRIGS